MGTYFINEHRSWIAPMVDMVGIKITLGRLLDKFRTVDLVHI